LQVPVLFDFGAIDAVEATGGHVVEVTDERVWDTQRLLAREEGVFVEPAGATALAGVLTDVARGHLEPDADVVAVLSGAGHKDSTAVARLAEGNTTLRVPADRVEAVFNRLQERV
jgi:threonine synthase